jgi:amino acid permease
MDPTRYASGTGEICRCESTGLGQVLTALILNSFPLPAYTLSLGVSSVAIVCINDFSTHFFVEREFWLSSIKVVVLFDLVTLRLLLALR